MLHHIGRRAFLSAIAGCLTVPLITQLSGCQGDTQPEPEKKFFQDPKLELLDLALQHEFGAVVQYGNHAGVIASLTGDSDSSIRGIMQDIIGHEVQHAILLTNILKNHNVEPTVAVWPPQTAVTAAEMIEKDIAAEDGAIKLYQQILMLDFDNNTKKNIEMIMHSEESHHHIFTEMLPQLGLAE